MPRGLTAKPGIQAIGIQVDSWAALAERFQAMGQSLETPGDDEAELLLRDPEGNVLVLSQSGWDRSPERAAQATAGTRG